MSMHSFSHVPSVSARPPARDHVCRPSCCKTPHGHKLDVIVCTCPRLGVEPSRPRGPLTSEEIDAIAARVNFDKAQVTATEIGAGRLDKLRRLRDLGWTWRRIASEIGVKPQTLVHYRSGATRQIPADVLDRIDAIVEQVKS